MPRIDRAKRIAHKIVIRCTLTGADWHMVRWLKDADEARTVAERALRYDRKFHAEHSRLVEVRPATHAEISQHRRVMENISAHDLANGGEFVNNNRS